MLNDDLDITFLETNTGPSILSVTPDRIVRNHKMIMVPYSNILLPKDTIEIYIKLLRSRYIRMVTLIKELLNKDIGKR
jgi:hypothetical protein